MYKTACNLCGTSFGMLSDCCIHLYGLKNRKGDVPKKEVSAANGLTRTIKAVNNWESDDVRSNFDLKDDAEFEYWRVIAPQVCVIEDDVEDGADVCIDICDIEGDEDDLDDAEDIDDWIELFKRLIDGLEGLDDEDPGDK